MKQAGNFVMGRVEKDFMIRLKKLKNFCASIMLKVMKYLFLAFLEGPIRRDHFVGLSIIMEL